MGRNNRFWVYNVFIFTLLMIFIFYSFSCGSDGSDSEPSVTTSSTTSTNDSSNKLLSEKIIGKWVYKTESKEKVETVNYIRIYHSITDQWEFFEDKTFKHKFQELKQDSWRKIDVNGRPQYEHNLEWKSVAVKEGTYTVDDTDQSIKILTTKAMNSEQGKSDEHESLTTPGCPNNTYSSCKVGFHELVYKPVIIFDNKLAIEVFEVEQNTEEQNTEEQKTEEQKTEEQKTEEQKTEEQKTEEQKTEEQKTEEQNTEIDTSLLNGRWIKTIERYNNINLYKDGDVFYQERDCGSSIQFALKELNSFLFDSNKGTYTYTEQEKPIDGYFLLNEDSSLKLKPYTGSANIVTFTLLEKKFLLMDEIYDKEDDDE